MSEVTQILSAIQRGDTRAADELLPLVYDELRMLARHKMAQEKPGQTLQATALVHEAYLRLIGDEGKEWDGRAHFFGAAAEAMRRILVDIARRKQCAMHGGDQQRSDLDQVEIATDQKPDKLLQVHELLDRLAEEDPIKADVVKLRYFVGLTNREIGDALGLSEPTVVRYWNYAKAWLFEAMSKD